MKVLKDMVIKFLWFLLISFLLSGKVNANETYVTCIGGECEFLVSIWYDYAETNCMQTLIMEEVDTGPISFEIIATGQTCLVFNEH